MNNYITNLLSKVKEQKNPLLIANEISYFLSDALRQNRLNLYEAYLLNDEVIRFRRLGYTKPAWNGRVRITTCIDLLNQKLLADGFDEDISANKYYRWGLEVFNLNIEKRSHYIMDKYNEYLEAKGHKDLLTKLLEIRQNYDKLSFDEGPYHNESFPYHFYSPEEILLNEEERRKHLDKKNLNEDIEELIVQLSILEL